MVYTASHRSLAILEILAHIDRDNVPELVVWEIEVPDKHIIEGGAIPADWRGNLPATRAYGDSWFAGQRSVGVIVPSVIVPEEQNVLLNPTHRAFSRGWAGNGVPFEFDRRLLA
jgi:RES domain-containing protein